MYFVIAAVVWIVLLSWLIYKEEHFNGSFLDVTDSEQMLLMMFYSACIGAFWFVFIPYIALFKLVMFSAKKLHEPISKVAKGLSMTPDAIRKREQRALQKAAAATAAAESLVQ